jgi:hypothetical protein
MQITVHVDDAGHKKLTKWPIDHSTMPSNTKKT